MAVKMAKKAILKESLCWAKVSPVNLDGYEVVDPEPLPQIGQQSPQRPFLRPALLLDEPYVTAGGILALDLHRIAIVGQEGEIDHVRRAEAASVKQAREVDDLDELAGGGGKLSRPLASALAQRARRSP